MAATTADLVNRFIELDEQRKAKEGEVDAIKEELRLLERLLMERFENAGMQSMKSAKGTTLYIRRELWAGAAEGAGELLLSSLKAVGLGDMVEEKVNTQTLSAYVREVEKERFAGAAVSPHEIVQALPEPLRKVVVVNEKHSLRTRKS